MVVLLTPIVLMVVGIPGYIYTYPTSSSPNTEHEDRYHSPIKGVPPFTHTDPSHLFKRGGISGGWQAGEAGVRFIAQGGALIDLAKL